MVVTLAQQYDVEEKPTVIPYTYIDRHAGTPNKSKTTKDAMGLDYSSVCNIGSRTVWVSMKEIYHLVMGVEQYILTSSNYGVEIKYI